ncbi:MAG TPA: nickel pincer cofactor biosynthesis protein LarB [Mycobacteriales bacterium]|nr:nickel pincer cofactor biosynthesis protein LarB [Mycobacteriales bacterium]
MDRDSARALLEQVASGSVSADQALDQIASAPYDDLGHSLVDLHRGLRTGDPEVVYAAGKTTEQVEQIVASLRQGQDRAVLITRADAATVAALVAAHPDITVEGGTVAVGPLPETRGVVAILAAGTSDGPVAAEAALTARVFGADVQRVDDVGVAGLHRLLAAKPALDRANCVIVVAGMEGALPSVVGGLVGTPLVAVPTSVGYGASMGGVAALLGMLCSCAPGVAVVNIDNGFGAGVFAARVARQARETT